VTNSTLCFPEIEWQIVLDALSNTIFTEELTDAARKNAKELFKITKRISKKVIKNQQALIQARIRGALFKIIFY
jgi:hypothetical protein